PEKDEDRQLAESLRRILRRHELNRVVRQATRLTVGKRLSVASVGITVDAGEGDEPRLPQLEKLAVGQASPTQKLRQDDHGIGPSVIAAGRGKPVELPGWHRTGCLRDIIIQGLPARLRRCSLEKHYVLLRSNAQIFDRRPDPRR